MNSSGTILARWFANNTNFGDALNPYLIERISGRRAINLQGANRLMRMIQVVSPFPFTEHMVVGSVLAWGIRRPGITSFWGPGFMSGGETLRVTPKKICAVRGPLSRKKLLDQGVDCPDVFGDPGLLMPRFYTPSPEIRQEFDLGVIPHYWDKKNPNVTRICSEPGVLFIDVFWDIERVVDAMMRCRRIASSSLHGLILADAYQLSSRWVNFAGSDLGVQSFKFLDYLASVRRPEMEPILVDDRVSAPKLFDAIEERESIIPNLDRLMEACPFRP
jgi:pyruvyltransferase